MCDLSTVRRTVWSGSQELAEIQMPAADATLSDTVENDALAVHRQRSAVMADAFYDANRFFGVVLNVQGPGTDQPVAVTRVNYADASDLHTGAVTWQAYAPYSLVGLWNNQGRVDRVVYGGTAAPGATALCVDPGTQYRCAFPGIDWGEFPYTRPGQATHTWQGTVLVDKPDATGTYYRRNRSYDPNTARFTQEDPLGLGGGLSVYGFASGDPVNYADPYGLCKVKSTFDTRKSRSDITHMSPQLNPIRHQLKRRVRSGADLLPARQMAICRARVAARQGKSPAAIATRPIQRALGPGLEA